MTMKLSAAAKGGAATGAAWTPDYTINPSGTRGEEKQPYVDFGGDVYLDMERYSSSAVLQQEWDRLFTKTWLIVGHVNDIPEKDCFMTVAIGRESFLLVRGNGDEVRGYYNICQHRGVVLVDADFGRQRSFSCPYHGWIYSNNGELAVLPGRETFREETLCHHSLDLAPIRVEVFRGFVFVTMNQAAPPLADYLGSRFAGMLGSYDLENFVRVYDVRQVWDVNWKVAMEAFIEGYHVSAVHTATLTPCLDDYFVQHDTYENGQGRSIFPFAQPAPSYLKRNPMKNGELNTELKLFLADAGLDEQEFPTNWADVKSAVIAGKRRNGPKFGFDYSAFGDDQIVDDWNMSFFPCATFNLHPEGVLFQRWMPDADDPRKTHYVLQIYAIKGDCTIPFYMPVHPDADRTGTRVLPVTRIEGMGGDAVGPVVKEDVQFIRRFQQGVESRGFKGAVVGEQEIRVRRFYDEYYRYMNRSKGV